MIPLRDWVEAVPFPVIVTDTTGIIQCHNAMFAKTFQPFAAKENIRNLFQQWEERGNHLLSIEFQGAPYLLLYHPIVNEGQDMVVYVAADGSHIKLLQQKITELDKLNRELDAIIENSYDAIYITDNQGTTLKTNSAIERITGIPKEYYIGKNTRDLMQRGILKESVTFKVLEQRRPVTVVQSNFAGKETLMTGTPVFNEEGEIEKVVTNIRDLSELNQLCHELNKALELNDQYRKELEKLKTKACRDPDVIVESRRMREIYDMADRIADFDATVLILGETGVGKDLLARHIYRASSRFGKGEFVKVNCGAIPHNLLETELFGYEAGAFTGASRSGKPGLFELAHEGVLFLDEVGELPLALQVKLLRVLQDKQVQRVGGTRPKSVDVRLIAATNRNLKEMVQKGTFREDLYYRLNVIPIAIPPLRERREDILPLVQYFLKHFQEKYQIDREFSRELKEFFYQYHWPGNVRELSNLVERLVLIVPATCITLDDLPSEYRQKEEQPLSTAKIKSLKEAIESAEREMLTIAVEKFNSTYKIAEELGTSQATIVRKLKKYRLQTASRK
ncbi:sigma 54-interacting transcriptional regulator [Brevibacillus sp. SYP-B805]|uniref:sigma-54 interaction domain-containing protein n=1 Tax=Brevibacillus sp. SYP-B805 TaxID=1578199 RepID=UPI0013ED6E4D|nr:sigma 54-interacting transcriptional regulator [Brevibacillus sp. SYP-B805]NGQ95810.1 sigma 54-interacting transcriptional regulator [Brevibacillus sp. SYP-B805]